MDGRGYPRERGYGPVLSAERDFSTALLWTPAPGWRGAPERAVVCSFLYLDGAGAGEMTMQMNSELCHGAFACLRAGSKHRVGNAILKRWQKVRSYVVWHIENLGWSRGLRDLCLCVHHRKNAAFRESGRRRISVVEESLRLQPGEWAEVKSIEEILATLDGNRRHQGLRWMTGMRRYCGRRFRVYKRVEKIMLETNGELREMKNTVLLEGVTCDGIEFGACDRSCFHFWREAWLRRVPKEPANGPNPGPTSPEGSEVRP
jgi:hypothetical protein